MTQRRTRRYARTAAVLAVLALLVPLAAPASAQTDLRILMRQKLELAQRLFGAVVLGRLPAVERDAAELVRVSETAAWMTAPTPEYFTHAADFQEAARDLSAAASAGDLGEVSSAYMTIVETCVQCHREALPRPAP